MYLKRVYLLRTAERRMLGFEALDAGILQEVLREIRIWNKLVASLNTKVLTESTYIQFEVGTHLIQLAGFFQMTTEQIPVGCVVFSKIHGTLLTSFWYVSCILISL